jgi:hypothetical protein
MGAKQVPSLKHKAPPATAGLFISDPVGATVEGGGYRPARSRIDGYLPEIRAVKNDPEAAGVTPPFDAKKIGATFCRTSDVQELREINRWRDVERGPILEERLCSRHDV